MKIGVLMTAKRNRNLTLGLIFIGIGLIILLSNLEIFYFNIDLIDLLYTYWPLLLVIWGLSLFRKGRNQEVAESELVPMTSAGAIPNTEDIPISETRRPQPEQMHKIIGDIVIRPQGKAIRSASYSVLIGEIFIDLSKAEAPKEPVKIFLNASIGSVRVMLNPAIAYRISATAIIGDVSINENKDSGFQAKLDWENEMAGNLVEIHLNTLIGDNVVW
jgi:predicted membrane protein